MRQKKVKLSALLLLSIGLTGLQAQEAISATGGDASGSGGVVNYTVGQVVYTTNTGTSGTVTQGVQQPFEIFVVTSLAEVAGITLQCSVYPNPTTDYLILKIEGKVQMQCFASLYDITGKLLESKKIDGNEISISMLNLTPTTYFLKVIRNEKEIKTFKIIKK
jgi:hypothetical protein